MIYPNDNTQMTILWQLSGTNSCTLSWGETTAYGTNQAVTEFGTDHQFQYTITGLTANTKYYYKVHFGSTDLTGTFKTAPVNSATAVKFLAYGDTRTYFMDTDDVTARMLTEISNDADYQTFSLHTGDWINKGQNASEDEWSTQFFNRSGTNNIDFQSKIPIMGTRGNHENYIETYDPYEPASNFYKFFPYDLATTPSEPGDDMYYSFDYGPVHIAVLDQYDNGSYGNDYGTGDPPVAISVAQRTWLENDLASSDKPWKFILLHEPAWSASSTSKDEHVNNADAQNNIQPICIQYGVQAIFGGHNHYYAHALVEGVHHFTLGGGGAPLYAPSYTSGGVVQYAEATFHFLKVDIDGNDATLTVVRPNGSVVETINLTIPILNPTSFTATPQVGAIDLSWTQNTDNDDILLAYNTSNIFGTPTGTYTNGDPITGGGEVIAVGDLEMLNHSGLTLPTYYYKLWSFNGTDYSDGLTTSASPIVGEPNNHVTNFLATNPTSSTITLDWTDATGGIEPIGYLIKAVIDGGTIINPVDGLPENDGIFTKNVVQGSETVVFNNLNPATTYNFQIFPYSNSGANIDYKTDGSIPTETETTIDAPTECGHETFDNMPSGMYTTITWTGQDGSTWTATDARTDQSLNGDAICVRDGYVESGTVTNGISSITISTQRAFSGGTGTVDISINGTSVGSVPYDETVQTTQVSEIDISGDIYITLTPSDDRIIIDDVIWECFGGGVSTDATSSVTNPTGGQVASATISSDETNCSNPVDVFSFDIEDDGATDGSPTIVTNIRLQPSASNTADWTDHIQGVKINDGSGFITTDFITIADSYIDISISAGELNIADGQATTVTAAICLHESELIDGSILSFKVNASNHGFAADAAGSQFASTFIADVTSNNFTISVVCSAPTEHASAIMFDNISQISTNINWTSGNGTNRIIIAKEGSEVDAIPTDNNSYTASSTFGSGDELGAGNFVVYKGNSDMVNISGLTENTTYYFKIFEYNCAEGNEKYFTTGTPASGNITTQPSSISVINSSINIYPNPTNGIIAITNSTNAEGKITISNVIGQNLSTVKLNSSITEINLSNFGKGVYFISINIENTIVVKKVIVK